MKQFAVCTEVVFWTLNRFPLKSIVWRKILECFHQIFFYFFSTKERQTWTSWMTWGQ